MCLWRSYAELIRMKVVQSKCGYMMVGCWLRLCYYLHPHTSIHTHARTHTQTHTNTHKHTHKYTHTNKHARTHTHTHKYMHLVFRISSVFIYISVHVCYGWVVILAAAVYTNRRTKYKRLALYDGDSDIISDFLRIRNGR